MKARIVITPTGEIAFFTEEGTFEAGAEVIDALLKQLQAQGINLTDLGQPEQHRHDDGHVHSHVHAGGH